MKTILIGGYPKGFDEPFHIKTTSGRILRKIVDEINAEKPRVKSHKKGLFIDPIYFDLWKTKVEEDARKLDPKIKKQLQKFISDGYLLISLGKYIEKVLTDNGIISEYLPHPASRDKKYIDILKAGLKSKCHKSPQPSQNRHGKT